MDIRSVAMGMLFGVGAATIVATMLWPDSRSDAAPAAGHDPRVSVARCAAGGRVTMQLKVSNPTDVPTSYQLLGYWFTKDGKQFLRVPVNTDAIPAGQSAMVDVGNPADVEDWQPGLTCQAKVVGQQ